MTGTTDKEIKRNEFLEKLVMVNALRLKDTNTKQQK